MIIRTQHPKQDSMSCKNNLADNSLMANTSSLRDLEMKRD